MKSTSAFTALMMLLGTTGCKPSLEDDSNVDWRSLGTGIDIEVSTAACGVMESHVVTNTNQAAFLLDVPHFAHLIEKVDSEVDWNTEAVFFTATECSTTGPEISIASINEDGTTLTVDILIEHPLVSNETLTNNWTAAAFPLKLADLELDVLVSDEYETY